MATKEFSKSSARRPCYIDREEARAVLAAIGVELSERQMKRATEKDAQGRRKLPFFVDPVDGRLRIEKNTLLRIYIDRQVDAENSCRVREDLSL